MVSIFNHEKTECTYVNRTYAWKNENNALKINYLMTFEDVVLLFTCDNEILKRTAFNVNITNSNMITWLNG